MAGPRSAVGRTPDSQVKGPGFNIQSGHILLFLLPLIQEGQLSVTGESMCTKYWLTTLRRSKPAQEKCGYIYRLTDRPDMTLDVYRGRKSTTTSLVNMESFSVHFPEKKTKKQQHKNCCNGKPLCVLLPVCKDLFDLMKKFAKIYFTVNIKEIMPEGIKMLIWFRDFLSKGSPSSWLG